MPAVERSTLRVEGPDDAHSIKHLLRQHHCICPIGKEQTESYTALAGRFVDWFKQVFECG